MRYLYFLISAIITIGLVISLSLKWGAAPPIGKFMSPQHGFWQNAEAADEDFSGVLRFPGLKGRTEVYLDERLVPHVFAEYDEDAYFVQGYLHAKFRLWQMEFQTHATAGRISEIIGAKAVAYDREQRRLGLTYAAENMVKEIESDEKTLSAVTSYTNGVNAYINNLTEADLPLEYKLLNYRPEPWSLLKTALFIKQLTKTLAGYGLANDFQYSSLRTAFSEEQMKMLFPYLQDSLSPVIPAGTIYDPPTVSVSMPPGADTAYFKRRNAPSVPPMEESHPGTGSNNWAVSGRKTASGYPILCNDPHLDLTLPAIWFEIQLNTPSMNAYGTSFPGIPGVVIGFNDQIAFGFTNGGVDVMDFYEIRFKDAMKKQYWYNGEWKQSRLRVEEIKVRDEEPFLDTVAYCEFGPVMYDHSFTNLSSGGKDYAVRWKAHDPSNELLMWWWLNRATNYEDFEKAIRPFTCPVQNIVFADKKGDIAIWQQGEVPLRWERQGVYLMPGYSDEYRWQGFIPQPENPHIINPERSFVSSANQRATDGSYPYYVPGDFAVYRGYRINRLLGIMDKITPDDMKVVQNDNHNTRAELMRPILLHHMKEDQLIDEEKRLFEIFRKWNLQNDPGEKGATIFEVWMDSLAYRIWADEFSAVRDRIYPDWSTLIDLLHQDSAFLFADDINTPEREYVPDMVTLSFKKAAVQLFQLERENRLSWANAKNTTIYHLLRNSAMPFAVRGLDNGGGTEIINATTHNNGPSWRMIVHLTPDTEAYGVYPGGQSGNPGSRFYDNFISTWEKGDYFRLWIMRKSEVRDKRVKWIMRFDKE